MKPVKLRFKWHGDQLEAHIARNGRFYGFVAIKKCNNPNFTAWYLTMLIPGGMDHDTNPVPTLREAKIKARTIVETVIADLQGVILADN